ncbi:hypothetical protein LR48_Vigan03g180000 [Vigna angularis]|uniref:Uncharacterized protein n=1 Tax=Phaseolus angularis TaxID=3914 RepID=A0A0L9U6G7_PHAAN|nr:hypothetical protein LR48_Vigan03g180000 [Vigna angularis]
MSGTRRQRESHCLVKAGRSGANSIAMVMEVARRATAVFVFLLLRNWWRGEDDVSGATAAREIQGGGEHDGDPRCIDNYCEMDFDADVCELEIDFNVLDHMHDVPVEVVDFTPCFDHSNIINSAFSIDRVHIPASSVFDDSTYLNALFDEESDAHDDRHAVFDYVKVDLAAFENACTDLGLELELEFAGFLNSLELNNEKLTACTCLGGGCEICEEISSAICSASNYFAGAKEEIIMFKLDGNDSDDVASDQRTQVYSELSIPIEFSKVQYEFNALDLFKVEPIEPTLDYVPVMPAHTHILDSAFSIENIDMPYAVSELCTGFDIIPVDDSFTVGVHSIADLVEFDKEAVDTKTTSVKAGDSVNTAQRAWK